MNLEDNEERNEGAAANTVPPSTHPTSKKTFRLEEEEEKTHSNKKFQKAFYPTQTNLIVWHGCTWLDKSHLSIEFVLNEIFYCVALCVSRRQLPVIYYSNPRISAGRTKAGKTDVCHASFGWVYRPSEICQYFFFKLNPEDARSYYEMIHLGLCV